MAAFDTDPFRPIHPFTEFRKTRRSGMAVAFVVALLLHVVLVLMLPEQLLRSAGGADTGDPEPLEITLLPPEPPDPTTLRYVEANPEAPENEPDREDQYSFRAQQAADENPESTPEDAPRVEGEEPDSQKIQQGAVESPPPLPPGLYAPESQPGDGGGTTGGEPGLPEPVPVAEAPPLPPPAFLQEPLETEEGAGTQPDLQNTETEAPDPNAPLHVYKPQDASTAEEIPKGRGDGGTPEARPTPRERPRLSPELTHGPLMRSTASASRRGSVAIDATFSEFGEYEQQFYAAVQAGWYQEIEYFQPIDTAARVRVRFTLQADGTIKDLSVVESSAGDVATFICESAISKRSPFRPWTKEMVQVFGKERTLHITFHYR